MLYVVLYTSIIDKGHFGKKDKRGCRIAVSTRSYEFGKRRVDLDCYSRKLAAYCYSKITLKKENTSKQLK